MKKIHHISILLALATGLSWGDLLSEGKKDYAEKNFASALEKFTQAKKEGETPMLSLNIGTTLFRMERFEEAIAEFKKAIQKGQGIILRNAWYNLGNTWYRKGQLAPSAFERKQNYQEAVLAYKEALDQDEDYDNARRNIEFVQKKLKEEQERLKNQANNTQNKALTRAGKEILAKAVQMTSEGKVKAARDLLNDGLKEDPALKPYLQRAQDVVDILEGKSPTKPFDQSSLEQEIGVAP
jgi:tetratricopeptide (TPR) repeat protein